MSTTSYQNCIGFGTVTRKLFRMKCDKCFFAHHPAMCHITQSYNEYFIDSQLHMLHVYVPETQFNWAWRGWWNVKILILSRGLNANPCVHTECNPFCWVAWVSKNVPARCMGTRFGNQVSYRKPGLRSMIGTFLLGHAVVVYCNFIYCFSLIIDLSHLPNG
jgi:hypothetical protein